MSAERATIVIDLGYGDAGKGSVIDFLARRDASAHPPLVVRFNGGPQAAHNVVTPDGRHHTFHQFGSASFLPGARTHLSRFMLVNPLRLAHEADELQALGAPGAHELLTIDASALVITPFHEAANRLRELARGDGRHGSCGHGIGETMADSIDHPNWALRAGDLAHPARAWRLLEQARLRKLAELGDLVPRLETLPAAARDLATLREPGLTADVVAFYRHFTENLQIVGPDHLTGLLDTTPHVLFEGAQGVLLDEWRGFHPYTTWSTTTFANADTLLAEAGYTGEVTRLGLLRAYFTRHGAGPFVTEDPVLTDLVPDAHNATNDWQREFRVGHFDLVAARYALEVAGGTSEIGITCLDRPVPRLVATSYAYRGKAIDRLVPGPFMDLGYQEHQLTRPILESTANYHRAPSDHEGYVDYLSAALGLPVALTSLGPTALHKRYQPAHIRL